MLMLWLAGCLSIETRYQLLLRATKGAWCRRIASNSEELYYVSPDAVVARLHANFLRLDQASSKILLRFRER